MNKPKLIDVLFDLQNEYDFNLTYTTDHKYIDKALPYINKKPRKERTKHSKRSNNSQIFYNSIQWKRLRNWYISVTPLCEECLKKGISTPAEHVHHKVPFMSGKTTEDKWRLLLDPLNIESLCIDCHHKMHEELRAKATKQDKQSLYHVVGK